MAKTQVQLNREHIARIRRKAHAFDKLSSELKTLTSFACIVDKDRMQQLVTDAIERAERQAGE